ncbi:hypothetical protein A2U01_0092391, partial [Trifolium medium]|nr:hypothetical protein [Trifolium medium]
SLTFSIVAHDATVSFVVSQLVLMSFKESFDIDAIFDEELEEPVRR